MATGFWTPVKLPSFVGDRATEVTEGDGALDISDAVSLLSSLFGGAGVPDCVDASDANDDGALDIGDPIFTLSFLFSSGTAMPAPGAVNCGPDPTTDALDCAAAISCP